MLLHEGIYARVANPRLEADWLEVKRLLCVDDSPELKETEVAAHGIRYRRTLRRNKRHRLRR